MDDLRAAGARGSSDSLAYAFGMQLNPELPRLDSDTIHGAYQSIFCVYTTGCWHGLTQIFLVVSVITLTLFQTNICNWLSTQIIGQI